MAALYIIIGSDMAAEAIGQGFDENRPLPCPAKENSFFCRFMD